MFPGLVAMAEEAAHPPAAPAASGPPPGIPWWVWIGIVATTMGLGFCLCRLKRRSETARNRETFLRIGTLFGDCLLWRATVVRDGDKVRWLDIEMAPSALHNRLFGDLRKGPADPTWTLLHVPELPQMNARSTEAILGGKAGYEQDFRAVRAGHLFWLREHVSVVQAGPDRWTLSGVVVDQTARREAEEATKASADELQKILAVADCMVWRARVFRRPNGAMEWAILLVPESHLHRKLFGEGATDHSTTLWRWADVPELPEMNARSTAAITSGAGGYEQEFRVVRGEAVYWMNEHVMIVPAGPDEWVLTGVVMDRTAQRTAEEAHKATAAQLQQVIAGADLMLWHARVVEGAGGELKWALHIPRSGLYRRLFGADPGAEPLLPWRDLVAQAEGDEMHERAVGAIRGGQAGYEQQFCARRGGKEYWLQEQVLIQAVSAGEWALVGVVVDVTARREAEEARRASEAQIDRVLSAADCMLWQARVAATDDGGLRWLLFMPPSRLYRAVFGRDPECHEGMVRSLWDDVVDGPTREAMHRRALEALHGGATFYEQEFRAGRPERQFWLHEHTSITPRRPGEWTLVGVITDITARREAELAVRTSELRYRTLFQHMPVAILETDFSAVGAWFEELRAKGVADLEAFFDAKRSNVARAMTRVRIVDVNGGTLRLFRAESKTGLLGRARRLFTGDALRVVRRVFGMLWAGGNTLESEVRIRDLAGQERRLHLRWWLDRNETGLDLTRSVFVLVDLTELKRAEAALAEEKERLAVTLRAMAEGVITADNAGRVQYANPAAAALAGFDAATVAGRPLVEVCPLRDGNEQSALESTMARLVGGGAVAELPVSTRLWRRDRAPRLVEGCCAPIFSADRTPLGMVLVFRDVTERERLEQELVRASKLESVGVLAGGIAHDFNNILTAIMGSLSLAALDLDDQTELGQNLREAERATLRARDLTQQLLTFAKGGEPVRAAVQLSEVIREVAAFSLHGARVKGEFDLPADLWPADADKGQIGRVVQNLVINAFQAMPEGGVVRIAARNETLADARHPTLPPGDYVRIEVADTGVGIRPEHLPQVFDPYFTTKKKGSGLGLAAAYSIVRKHRGFIDVVSEVGRGSTFRFWIPALRGRVLLPPSPPPAVHLSGGRILFMDDEPSIRRIGEAILQRLGFEVVAASDGEQAVGIYRRAMGEGRPFTAVIMDLTVPGGMGGHEALLHLLQYDPHVKAIVSSGYSSDPVLAHFRDHGFSGMIPKPYEVDEFARVLRTVLGQKAGD